MRFVLTGSELRKREMTYGWLQASCMWLGQWVMATAVTTQP